MYILYICINIFKLYVKIGQVENKVNIKVT
jgi:hypothetical protein